MELDLELSRTKVRVRIRIRIRLILMVWVMDCEVCVCVCVGGTWEKECHETSCLQDYYTLMQTLGVAFLSEGQTE